MLANVNEGETSKQTKGKNHTEMDSNGRPWSIFIECAFQISDIATIVNEQTHKYAVVIIMLFKSYACSMLDSPLFSRTIGYVDASVFGSVLVWFLSFCIVSFDLALCACVCPFSFVYYDHSMLSNACLWLESFWARRKRNESKAEALNLIQSALDFQCHAIPSASLHAATDRFNLQSDEIRYNAPAQVIGFTQTIKLFRKGNAISFEQKIIEIIC